MEYRMVALLRVPKIIGKPEREPPRLAVGGGSGCAPYKRSPPLCGSSDVPSSARARKAGLGQDTERWTCARCATVGLVLPPRRVWARQLCGGSRWWRSRPCFDGEGGFVGDE